MDLFAIECFLAVAECNSFSKAALRLNRTQSAITQQIGNLEQKLERKLFRREKNVVLTQDGEKLFPYAQKMYELRREILSLFIGPEKGGEVRIGVPEDFAGVFLSEVLINFSRIHPEIHLNVECDLTRNLLKRFESGALDLVIIKMRSAGEFPFGTDIWQEPLVWVQKHGRSSFPEEGNPLSLAVFPEPCVYRARAVAALEDAGIPYKIVYTSPSYSGIIAAVKAGMGVTPLPVTMIPSELKQTTESLLPPLPDIHVSLLKQLNKKDAVIDTLYEFLLEKLRKEKHPKKQLG